MTIDTAKKATELLGKRKVLETKIEDLENRIKSGVSLRNTVRVRYYDEEKRSEREYIIRQNRIIIDLLEADLRFYKSELHNLDNEINHLR